LARLDESIAAFNQRFIFPLPFAMKIIKINLWNQGSQIVVANIEISREKKAMFYLALFIVRRNRR
jgi:hypothetical protein